jgi:hypothetical protein
MKRPAFQFYPREWLADVELQACSLASRGLWINACSVMHNCTPYGHLTINGAAMTDDEAAQATHSKLGDYKRCIAELLRRGVAKQNEHGIIYSARLVKDEAAREYQASFGRLSLNNPNVPRPKEKATRRDIPHDTPGGGVRLPSSAFAVASINKSGGIRTSANGPAPWFTTQAGIVDKAKALAIEPAEGETIEALRDRVRSALKNLQR